MYVSVVSAPFFAISFSFLSSLHVVCYAHACHLLVHVSVCATMLYVLFIACVLNPGEGLQGLC